MHLLEDSHKIVADKVDQNSAPVTNLFGNQALETFHYCFGSIVIFGQQTAVTDHIAIEGHHTFRLVHFSIFRYWILLGSVSRHFCR